MSKYAWSWSEFFKKWKPFFGVIFIQFAAAGMDILSKAALNEGMSSYVFVVYCHVAATIVLAPFAVVYEKRIRPKMTLSIFIKLMTLALLGPVLDQNLFFMGMKATTATFAAAMTNILPAITFVMACILRLEKVKLKSIRSQAKIIGTATTIAGAMIMTLIKGPLLELFWTKGRTYHQVTNVDRLDAHHSLKGAIMIAVGLFSWSAFMVLQAIALKSYPAELSMTAWICFLGSVETSILALIMERGNTTVWAIKWNIALLATIYCGVVSSGLVYYVQGVVMTERGPVFVNAFSPLCMIIVAVMGSIILAERMYLGMVIGAVVIVAGLYLVIWGKSKDYKVQSVTIGEQKQLEKQTLDKELEESSYDKENTIIAPDGPSDNHDRGQKPTTSNKCISNLV